MAFIAAKCTQCGANIEVDDTKEAGICPHCGTAFVTEKAINNYTININTSLFNDEMDMDKIYLLARRAAETENFDNALKYYDMILLKNPNSWEANFGMVFYKAMQSSVKDVSSAAGELFNNLDLIFSLIKDNASSRTEEIEIVRNVYSKVMRMACLFYDNSVRVYENIDSIVKHEFYNEHIDRLSSICALLYKLGDSLDQKYHKNNVVGSFICDAWKEGVKKNLEFYKTLFGKNKKLHKSMIKIYVAKIKEYEPKYKSPKLFFLF